MARRTLLILLMTFLLFPACRRETPSPPEEAAESVSAETQTDSTSPPPREVREVLDELQPAIPLWPGSRSTANSVRQDRGVTIIDLWSNDPFPMVWHYYVTYLAQYRAWKPLDPFPSSGDVGRHLELDLTEVMQDPFVPGTALEREDVRVSLMIREDPTRNRVNIRYLIQPVK